MTARELLSLTLNRSYARGSRHPLPCSRWLGVNPLSQCPSSWSSFCSELQRLHLVSLFPSSNFSLYLLLTLSFSDLSCLVNPVLSSSSKILRPPSLHSSAIVCSPFQSEFRSKSSFQDGYRSRNQYHFQSVLLRRPSPILEAVDCA